MRFNYIHSSIDVKAEIIDNFLSKHGTVYDWWPVLDSNLKIPTGPHIFVMKEEDIRKNPLPPCVYLNHMLTYISHRNQPTICHYCKAIGHVKRKCPVLYPELAEITGDKDPALPSTNGTGHKNFLSGNVPTREDYIESRRALQKQAPASMLYIKNPNPV